MERRAVLSAIGGSLAVGVAGCVTIEFGDTGNGDGADADEDGDGDTDEPGAATADESGSGSLDAAVAALSANNEQFGAYAEAVASSVEEAPTTFDDRAVTDRVERARRNLSAADAADEAVAALSGLADAHEHAASMFDRYATGVVDIGSMNQFIGRSDYGAARADARTAHRAFRDAETHGQEVTRRLREVDTGDISGVGVSVGPFRDAVAELDRRSAVLDLYLDGMEPFLEGMTDLLTAENALGRGEYDTAERGYEAAAAHYREAVTEFDDSELDDVEDVMPGDTVATVRCRVEALADASPTLADAARAYGRGDRTRGDDLSRQARQRIRQCTQRSSTGGSLSSVGAVS